MKLALNLVCITLILLSIIGPVFAENNTTVINIVENNTAVPTTISIDIQEDAEVVVTSNESGYETDIVITPVSTLEEKQSELNITIEVEEISIEPETEQIETAVTPEPQEPEVHYKFVIVPAAMVLIGLIIFFIGVSKKPKKE